jgi:alpha-galactosidase
MKRFIPLLIITAVFAAAVADAADSVAVPSDLSGSIRTPKAPESPRINGPHIFGARPSNPFFYHLPVTGARPLSISAKGLPDGLALDAATGNITGSVAQAGEYNVDFTAKNAKGTDTASLKIVIGKTICLTPPLGWNSWNKFACGVDDAKVRGAADAMVASGLVEHGWTYINIDDCWEGGRDADGRIQANKKFPDMKALSDYIHGKGLKFGIYSSPGPKTCAGYEATYAHEDQDARTYADWGVDYVKYDWCSYGQIADGIRLAKYATLIPGSEAQLTALDKERHELAGNRHRTPAEEDKFKQVRHDIDELLKKIDPEKKKAIDLDIYKEPYRVFRQSLDKVPRDIVFSFCQYGMGSSWEWAGDLGGNCWRTTGDISANWKSISNIGFNQNGHEPFARPGHWNDPDMLEIGNGSLTPDELHTHMTLWCMLSAPLLIGCDMTKMDDLTVSIFSNDEVLAVNQNSLGKQGWRAKQEGQTEVWMKPLADGSLAVAFFNRGETPIKVSVSWQDLKLQGSKQVRDLWRQKDLGKSTDSCSIEVGSHGAELLRLSDNGR